MDGDTPLHKAAMKGHVQICELFIEKMNDIDSRDFSNNTPLLFAAVSGHGKLCEILMAKVKLYIPSTINFLFYILAATINCSSLSLFLSNFKKCIYRNQN